MFLQISYVCYLRTLFESSAKDRDYKNNLEILNKKYSAKNPISRLPFFTKAILKLFLELLKLIYLKSIILDIWQLIKILHLTQIFTIQFDNNTLVLL